MVEVPETVLKGEVVFLYAMDVAYELRRPIPSTLLGHALMAEQVGPAKRSPRQHFLQQVHTAHLEPVSLPSPHGGQVLAQQTVKVLPIGAVSLMLRVPCATGTLTGLGIWQEPAFAMEVVHRHLSALGARIHAELSPHAVRPASTLPEGEAYTVFCLQPPLGPGGQTPFLAEAWFEQHRREIAGLLTQDTDGGQLSTQEVEESTSQHLSYFRNDLVVVDWDAALVVDQPADIEETLHVLELANIQLEELISYDRILDVSLERSYADLLRPPKWFNRKSLIRNLREVRVDLARLSDETTNITKFFGDWHLARLYEAASRRFHLADWHHAIDEKLKTLDDLYEMLKQEQDHRLMVVLEASIVAMFLIDITMLFLGLAK